MQALMPNGSVIDWPEWASTTPQSDWTEQQSNWMAAHQRGVLDMQKEMNRSRGYGDTTG